MARRMRRSSLDASSFISPLSSTMRSKAGESTFWTERASILADIRGWRRVKSGAHTERRDLDARRLPITMSRSSGRRYAPVVESRLKRGAMSETRPSGRVPPAFTASFISRNSAKASSSSGNPESGLRASTRALPGAVMEWEAISSRTAGNSSMSKVVWSIVLPYRSCNSFYLYRHNAKKSRKGLFRPSGLRALH